MLRRLFLLGLLAVSLFALPIRTQAQSNLAAPNVFRDVSQYHWAASWINQLYNEGVTGGCSTDPLKYCPDNTVNRAQMAVFLVRVIHGQNFTPPAATTIFGDVPASHWANRWINQLYTDGVTGGCSTSPLLFCPDAGVSRAQMAVFLLRAVNGKNYTPPASGNIFGDVPSNYWAHDWISQFYNAGYTGGCTTSPLNFCPNASLSRAQMAVFLLRAIHGTTYSPPAIQLVAPSISGCQILPQNNVWNTPVDNLPVHPLSDQWVNTLGRTANFHMHFSSGTYNGGPIGLPYNVVSGASVTKYNVNFQYYLQSDPGPYPIPSNPLIEWGSDAHVLVLDTDNCRLYELYEGAYANGQWSAGSGAVWDLSSNALRPNGWTSADAAGLPILPGLVRYDEVASGFIYHALRFSARYSNSYIWPARHLTSGTAGVLTSTPPFGARFRLKASYDISGFPPEMQVVLQAMKTYGIILADTQTSDTPRWTVQGTPDLRWDQLIVHTMDVLTGNDFEAVDESSMMLDVNSGRTR